MPDIGPHSAPQECCGSFGAFPCIWRRFLEYYSKQGEEISSVRFPDNKFVNNSRRLPSIMMAWIDFPLFHVYFPLLLNFVTSIVQLYRSVVHCFALCMPRLWSWWYCLPRLECHLIYRSHCLGKENYRIVNALHEILQFSYLFFWEGWTKIYALELVRVVT